MNTATTQPVTSYSAQPGFFARTVAWLDARGKPAWIIAMVLGFILFWPLGLAILAYVIWSKRMFNSSCKAMKRDLSIGGSSGNSAFDAYKADTLRRLQEEQDNFAAFMKRLRDAKDKAEFDQFMEDQARKPAEDAPTDAAEKA